MNFSNQTILNKTFKVGIYIRLSREDGDKLESESVSNQRDILQRYIKENNHILVDEYIDDGYSGTTFERPSFERMISDIENQKINMVITKDLSRLGRDYIKTGYYIENYFPENKVRYVAILDGVDTYLDTSNNDVTPFKAIINDMYAKDISKKIKGVLKEKELKAEEQEKKVQKAIIDIKKKYGKNAILKAMNLEEGGTTIERNGQVGGHKG